MVLKAAMRSRLYIEGRALTLAGTSAQRLGAIKTRGELVETALFPRGPF